MLPGRLTTASWPSMARPFLSRLARPHRHDHLQSVSRLLPQEPRPANLRVVPRLPGGLLRLRRQITAVRTGLDARRNLAGPASGLERYASRCHDCPQTCIQLGLHRWKNRNKSPPDREETARPRRERFLTREERQKIFDNYPEGDCFRDYLFALEHTGCRPGEVANVTAEQVDLRSGVWIFDKHKTGHKTGEPRIVILTPEMIALTKRLMNKHPEGPLFRDAKGNSWNRNSIRCRFRRVRKKLGLGGDLVAYLYRHAVATDLLETGAGLAQTAELLGHRGVEMVMRHYQKLKERRTHLRDQITRATRKDGGSGETPRHPLGDGA